MRRDTPGPPLLADPEYCATAAPSPGGYARATLFGLLAGLLGGAIWYMVMAATAREWSGIAIGLGLVCGWAVHYGAYRLRSRWTGWIGVIATLAGALLAHYPLWRAGAPGSPAQLPPSIHWIDLLFALAALVVAYRTSGPNRAI